MARYADAVRWIAHNDALGDYDDRDQLAGYVSVVLVADLWNKSARDVADDVFAHRERYHLGGSGPYCPDCGNPMGYGTCCNRCKAAAKT